MLLQTKLKQIQHGILYENFAILWLGAVDLFKISTLSLLHLYFLFLIFILKLPSNVNYTDIRGMLV